MKFVSFNINGLRSKIPYIENTFGNVDIIFIQEAKLSPKLSFPLFKKFYEYHGMSDRPGRKGVTILINKNTDLEVLNFKQEIFKDEDGRILVMNIKKNNKVHCLINVYIFHVNDVKNQELLKRKVEYVNWFINLIKKYIRENENIIVAGDSNMSRSITPYDIYKTHRNPSIQPGFSPTELKLFKKFSFTVKGKLVDVQLLFAPKKIQYSFFSQRTTISNIMFKHHNGMTVDHIHISKHLYKYVKNFKMDYKFYGISDHVPLIMDIEI